MKQLTVLVLFMLSTSAGAEWTRVSHSDKLSSYADLDTVKKTGDMVRMWGLRDYKTTQRLTTGQGFLSAKSEWEYDCDGERLRVLYTSSHSRNMGRGRTIGVEKDVRTWLPVYRGS